MVIFSILEAQVVAKLLPIAKSEETQCAMHVEAVTIIDC